MDRKKDLGDEIMPGIHKWYVSCLCQDNARHKQVVYELTMPGINIGGISQ